MNKYAINNYGYYHSLYFKTFTHHPLTTAFTCFDARSLLGAGTPKTYKTLSLLLGVSGLTGLRKTMGDGLRTRMNATTYTGMCQAVPGCASHGTVEHKELASFSLSSQWYLCLYKCIGVWVNNTRDMRT